MSGLRLVPRELSLEGFTLIDPLTNKRLEGSVDGDVHAGS
jgi:hypothetical protein